MPHLRVLIEDIDRPVKVRPPIPSHYDDCVSCRSEPHVMHETEPNGSPIIVCAGACKTPTRHRFSRHMAATGASMSAQHLVWACTACEGERIYGCVG
jgi:hypothetical protein